MAKVLEVWLVKLRHIINVKYKLNFEKKVKQLYFYYMLKSPYQICHYINFTIKAIFLNMVTRGFKITCDVVHILFLVNSTGPENCVS